MLIAVKLGDRASRRTASALLSEALHSGTDLVAALLTFFAVGVAARPADEGHEYGHGKAEHLAALAEASILVLAEPLRRRCVRSSGLTGSSDVQVDAAWYALVVVGIVIVIDASRTIVSWRAARELHSAALESNALHFFSDLLGSAAVLVGLAVRSLRLPRRGLDRGAVRRRARARRRRAPDAHERRRADGPRAC